MNTQAPHDTLNEATPDHAAHQHFFGGWATTWTTPAGTWRIRQGLLQHPEAQGPGLHLRTDDTAAMLTVLRAVGALPHPTETDPVNLTERPEDTIRRYAKELVAIDSTLTGAGFDYPQGAQGVADLAEHYTLASNQRTAVYAAMSAWPDAVPTGRLREIYDGEGDELDPGTRTKLAQALESWLNEHITGIDLPETAWGIVHGIRQAVAFLRGDAAVVVLPGAAAVSDERFLLTRAAELIAGMASLATQPQKTEDELDDIYNAWDEKANSWLELHEAYIHGVSLHDMATTEDESKPYDNAAEPVVHEDADPGRPAGMGPTAPINPTYHPIENWKADHTPKNPADHVNAPQLATGGLVTSGIGVDHGYPNKATYFVDIAYDEREDLNSREQDEQRPDGCTCTYRLGDTGTRIATKPGCPVHGTEPQL